MLIINYNACGQTYHKDVSEEDVTREELIASVVRCNNANDIEDVDMNQLDNRIYFNRSSVEDLLTYSEEAYLLLSGDEGLFYVGPEKWYGKVVGAIKAHQRYGHPLPESLD